MKATVVIVSIIAFLQLLALSPAIAQRLFDVAGMGLMNIKQADKPKLRFGESRAVAIQKLGNPTRVSEVFFEIEAETVVVFHYQNNKLYFLRNELTDFELRDNTLAFGNAKQVFRVGDKLITVKKPGNTNGSKGGERYLLNNTPLIDLIVDNEPGKSMNINYKRIAYNSIRYGDKDTDAGIELLFDANNALIFISVNQTN